ncbi:MAG: tetratricopeptide repeat protein [Proteobacteria bacterium]|nr:tetratricopeptide repeat protein [Pseudomonadota bacterium]MCP4917196.1 tetratricopeptide repeat protein [Pseudomonadota bacterium]
MSETEREGPDFDKAAENVRKWTENAGKKIGEWTKSAGSKTAEGANKAYDWAGENMKFEVDPERIDESLDELGTKLRGLVNTGRYTKVRLKYKGKQIGPDLPMAVVLASEVATAFWAGPLRLVVVNLGIKAIIDIELVHEASNKVREGLDYWQDGESDLAEAKYREALDMKADDTSALYNLGVVLRVTGRKDEARECFLKAGEDEEHPDGRRAREALGRMEGKKREPVAD